MPDKRNPVRCRAPLFVTASMILSLLVGLSAMPDKRNPVRCRAPLFVTASMILSLLVGSSVMLDKRNPVRCRAPLFMTSSSRCSVLHYGSVAPCFAMILQRGRFWALALASRRSMSNSFRSSATLRSQVERGRPGGLLQFSAGCSNRSRPYGPHE